MDTIGGSPLTCDQQRVGTSSEDGIGQNMEREHRNTKQSEIQVCSRIKEILKN